MPLDMTYDSDAIYDRGAVIVNTMMNYMGRENFLTGIRHYLETYSYGASSSEQLRDALTEATGIDMNGFFDNYVFIGGMPHYSVDIAEVTPNGNQYDTHIKTSYWHVGPSHLGMNNRVEVTFVGADCQLQTQMICWDGMEDDQVVTLDFEPIAAFVDYYNHFLDAKTDGNLTATAPASLTQGKFKASVNSVTDSVMLRLEDHCIGPDNDPEIPYLTLSTCHYWNFFRNDIGDATVNAQISFTNSGQDGDIIQTENDSAVLLYRSDINDTWHTIPYTQEGNWKIGRFNVTDVQTGQYTIGVIDKMIWLVNEQSTQLLNIYPIPSQGFLTVETEPADYQITNLSGQTVMTGRVESKRVDISRLSSGTYFIIINGITKKFIVQ